MFRTLIRARSQQLKSRQACISVQKNGMRLFCSSTTTNCKSPETPLSRHIRAKILLSGPITVAEYMKEVLTHPGAGYYMNRDVFGAKGDFITSPEISQIFGELIGIWCVHEWMRSGSPPKLNIVELGPGRGTLADDILRVCAKFPGLRDAVSLHLVDVSPKNRETQLNTLTKTSRNKGDDTDELDSQSSKDGIRISDNISNDSYDISSNNSSDSIISSSSGSKSSTRNSSNNHSTNSNTEISRNTHSSIDVESCRSSHGFNVRWYQQLADVPNGFSFFIANEFFDALPIHKFQRTDMRNKWHEVFIDIDDDPSSPHHLRYVLSKHETAASKILLNVSDMDTRDHIELCPEGAVIASQIAQRIANNGGYALIADYGHSGDKTDTFRAFRKHQLCDPLSEPGSADLTADVDFSYLNRAINSIGNRLHAFFVHLFSGKIRIEGRCLCHYTVCTHGPITQATFLNKMGINVRLQVLMMNSTTLTQRMDLLSGYDMLTNVDKMGERFKFFALTQKQLNIDGSYEPAGFFSLHDEQK